MCVIPLYAADQQEAEEEQGKLFVLCIWACSLQAVLKQYVTIEELGDDSAVSCVLSP